VKAKVKRERKNYRGFKKQGKNAGKKGRIRKGKRHSPGGRETT